MGENLKKLDGTVISVAMVPSRRNRSLSVNKKDGNVHRLPQIRTVEHSATNGHLMNKPQLSAVTVSWSATRYR